MNYPEATRHDYRSNTLWQKLGGDLTAATFSAILVSPTVTIIDRALVEKASYHKPLPHSLRSHALAALQSPKRFIFSRPYGYNFTLYATTYFVANGSETVTKETHPSISSTVTFLCTLLVNVPLGVWKDIRFAQAFGISNHNDPARKTLLVPRRTGSAAATATFLVRDAITIYGSFQLAHRCSSVIPDSLASHPYSKIILTQMAVPVLSQLAATPFHLLGLDLYNRQYAVPWTDRFSVVWRYLPSATVIRCVRIIPAFGFGILTNMGLRSFFHSCT
ncbi:hypothetical protein BGW36DRAFT_446658 [Talaromyces proteolyticus]|uniref:Sequence orphan n=1 Tax=Talaromyces proteolyticus TaxID=1131652 RepID=A0AAD4KSP8_9EURO|nr:uncharacterized protein BGW36DRAFT_446658 [Talaromyces proteolyticus]KAH8700213.1 hypothetical protein BGW36DRAFT_446658 [Talaromyces proteolyticus]